jgi:hypothetical protein
MLVMGQHRPRTERHIRSCHQRVRVEGYDTGETLTANPTLVLLENCDLR